MTAPLATIADALIEFILSLLRDPAAAQEFSDDAEGTLQRKGLSDACAADVRAVAPVIADRPDVDHRVVPPPYNPPSPPDVVREIVNVLNTFHIDNRATIIDQSVNQSIWADGDVTQIFDQEAVVASGDNSVAAGEDADVDNSETNVSTGDIAIGNTDTTTNIDGSFNDSSTDADTDVDIDIDESFDDSSTGGGADADAADEPAPAVEVEPGGVTVSDAGVTVDAVPPAPPAPEVVESVEVEDTYESVATDLDLPLELEYDES